MIPHYKIWQTTLANLAATWLVKQKIISNIHYAGIQSGGESSRGEGPEWLAIRNVFGLMKYGQKFNCSICAADKSNRN